MFHSDDNEQSHCHDTVSRLVVCCRCVVTGYFYILDNFVSYREPYLIGPFECAVYARMPSTPVLTWRVWRCPCWFVARGRDSVLLEFVLYRALVLPGVSGCCMSAAYNGAVVAEVLIPAFGQRLAEQITY